MSGVTFGGKGGIRFDGEQPCVQVTTATDACLPAPGVNAIRVGEESLKGIVGFAGGVSVSGNTVVVTQSGSGAQRLLDLLDVAITTDGNGDPIIPEGAVLRFQDYETGGVWIADDTLDGGGY